jgi:hypothetical protein
MDKRTLKCDFCGASNGAVAWSYPCRLIVIQGPAGPVGMSPDAWAACDICHELIERGNRYPLAVRCAEGFDHPELGIPRDVIMKYATYIHNKFFEARSGAATPYYGCD